jgi:hypothetical protein
VPLKVRSAQGTKDVPCDTAQPLCALSSDVTTFSFGLTRIKQPYDVATEYVPVSINVPPTTEISDRFSQKFIEKATKYRNV